MMNNEGNGGRRTRLGLYKHYTAEVTELSIFEGDDREAFGLCGGDDLITVTVRARIAKEIQLIAVDTACASYKSVFVRG